MSANDCRQREVQIESYRESHLTTEGIMDQVEGFISTEGGDLEYGPKINRILGSIGQWVSNLSRFLPIGNSRNSLD